MWGQYTCTLDMAAVTIVSDYCHLPQVAFVLSGSHEESKQRGGSKNGD